MQNVNYINHLNGVQDQFVKDSRLNPTHISMYMALFKFWNYLHFPKTFHINREEIMQLSKIGSKATYHRVIKELSLWKYIVYMPSNNPFKGSKVKMLNFDTTCKPPLSQYRPKLDTTVKQELVSKDKRNKTIKNNINGEGNQALPVKNEVIEFFKTENGSETDALKFFNHYQAIGWKLNNKTPIEDWQAMAQKWMLKTKEFEIEKTNEKQLSQIQDNHLHTIRNKNYNQPL
ncbi:hypothetical protein NO995_00990 [Aestuariibaculum sp. M13]|nr:hypothetical protein [Aestuariibaculum sp. M13]